MAGGFSVPKELEKKNNLIAGKRTEAKSGKTFDVVSPVSGEVLAKVPLCGPEDVDRAIAAAREVWQSYKLTPIFKRSALVRRIAEIIVERHEVIAAVLSMEQGKSYQYEAIPEVLESAKNFTIAADDIVRLETPIIPIEDGNKRVLTFKEGVGVMTVITPWNFPTVIPSEYLGPGLAAGNTIVIKPASYTPLSMILMGDCIQKALDELGFPKGVFNLITGSGKTLGPYLVSHPGVDMIGFTGETVTGQDICSRAGIRKTLMELGGNGPEIVCEDANLEAAAKAAAYGCFYNSGQVCCATERILVHKKIHDQFVKLLVKEAKEWKLANPMEKGPTAWAAQQRAHR
jgi:succinate-semialdehyde dehydrogenase/glutarate-semialdehyde dehydrogenase